MSRRHLLWAYLSVIAAALAAYATALHGSFVNWDDEWLVLRNPYVRDLTHLGTVLDPFATRMLLGAEYLPLRDLNTILDIRLFGLNPLGYRFGNWVLYGLTAGLGFTLLLEVLRDHRAAFAGALLWAVHPLHAEVVAWASARKDLLNAVFALLAAVLWLRGVRTGSVRTKWAAHGAFLLATLSKSSAAALPGILALHEVLTGDRSIPPARRLFRATLGVLPMLVVAAAGAALHSLHQAAVGAGPGWRGGDWLTNLFVVAGVHLRYLRQAVLPYGLANDYAADIGGAGGAWTLAGLGLSVLLAVGAILAARRAPRVAWCGHWWLLLLVPVSNVLVPITNLSADRYLFLPTLGACALAGLGLSGWAARGPGAARSAAAALAAVTAVFGLLSARQALVWRDSVALWSNAVEVSPRCGRAWMNHGEALAAAGRIDEALASFRRMIEAEPLVANLWVHAGNRLYALGGPERIQEVEAILQRGVAKAGPTEGGPLVALAWLRGQQGDREGAVRLLQEAVRRQPRLPQAHYNLGIWHEWHRRWEEACEEYGTALDLWLPLPDQIDTHRRLVGISEQLGDAEGAARHRARVEELRLLSGGE